MNAQEKLIEYANKIKAESNGLLKNWSAQEIMGKAIMEGAVIARTPSTRTICNAKREGKIITVTETVIGEEMEVVDGRGIFHETRTTTEVLKVEL